MKNECKTWDYLVSLGKGKGKYCPFAQACLGAPCMFVEQLEKPEKYSVNPETGLERFYKRLSKSVELKQRKSS